jgi:hypothetical protein
MTTAQSTAMTLAQNDPSAMPVSEDGIGALLFVFLVLFLLSGVVSLMKRAGSQPHLPVSSSNVAVGEPLIAISQLPRELQEPLRAFRRRGVKYLTAAELRRVYDECSRLAEGRTRLYEHETDLLRARTAHELAVAAAKFVAALNPEERALLQMRIEAQARLDVDRLRAENAELASQVAHFRQLSGPNRS